MHHCCIIKHFISLVPVLVPWRKILNPWNFLSNGRVLVIHEPLGSPEFMLRDETTQDGDWPPDRPSMSTRVGLGLGASPILGEDRGMENELKNMVSDPINQVYPMKPQ